MLGGVAATCWSGLLLAELGRFNAVTALVSGLVAGGLLFVWGFRRAKGSGEHSHAADLLALVVAGLSLLVALPADEMVLGGWDPGVYVHTAAAVSQHGSLQIPADDITSLPMEHLEVVSRPLHRIREPFLGMRPLRNGKLSPQFFHGFPCLMAVLFSFFGLRGALALNPLLGAGCVLAVYALVKRIYGQWWGLAAAVLLAINPAQIWQTKFPTAELLTQFLLLGGTAMLLRAARAERKTVPSLFSGALLGSALLVRYDTLIFMAPMLLLLLWYRSGRHAGWETYLVVGAVLLGALHAWLHVKFVAPYYRPLPGLVRPAIGIASVAGIALLVLGVLPEAFRTRVHRAAAALRPGHAAALVFAVFVVFAWYVRPRLTMEGRVFRAVSACLGTIGQDSLLGLVANENAWNMFRLKAVFGWPGLLLGCGGICVMLATLRPSPARAWLVTSLCVMVLLVTNVFHDLFLMWVCRRFIPVITPLLVVGIVAVARGGFVLLKKRSAIAAAACCCLCMLAAVAPVVRSAHTMAVSRNWPGLVAWYEQLNAALPGGSTVFCDQPGFAAPLRFLYGHKSYEVIDRGPKSQAALEAMVTDVAVRDRDVFFLSMRGEPMIAGAPLVAVSRHELSSHIRDHRWRVLPRQLKGRGGDFVLYRIGGNTPPQ